MIHKETALLFTLAALAGGCARSQPATTTAAAAPAAAPAGPRNPGRYPYTRADVDFITGMISHHAQALDMAKLAPTNGASRPIQILTARIINAQTDEIVLLQQWLSDRNLPVPEAKAMPTKMMMGGMEHEMMMPGMLTDAQMKELSEAKGPDFDRLFLRYMIQHHQGALTMVDQLMSSGGAQDDAVYKFSSDIFADQSAEIDRMQMMLTQMQSR